MSKRSFIYRTKSSGPKMLPCGTSETTGSRPEKCPFTQTHCILEDRYALNHNQRSPVIPSLYRSSLCGTESNAF